jgi:hypothetical protein
MRRLLVNFARIGQALVNAGYSSITGKAGDYRAVPAPAQWAGFITRLLASDEADAVVLLGSPLEKRDAEGIAGLVPAAWRSHVAVWAGSAPIREQPALAAAANALISVLERVIGKAPCGPCQNTPRMAACRANICLTQLPEDALFAGWKRLMAQPRTTQQAVMQRAHA